MPATCLFEFTGHKDFLFPARGSSVTVQPGGREELSVSFAPQSVDDGPDRSASIKISVLHNQFDTYMIKLQGTTYACDAMVKSDFKCFVPTMITCIFPGYAVFSIIR